MGVPAFYRWCVAWRASAADDVRPSLLRAAAVFLLLNSAPFARSLCPPPPANRLSQKYGKCIEDCVEDPPGTDIEGPNPNGVEFDA